MKMLQSSIHIREAICMNQASWVLSQKHQRIGILTNSAGINFITPIERGRYMFKQAIIHYPADENALTQIYKEIASFRCAVAVEYIKTLNLNDKQIETLFSSLEEEIIARREESA